MRWSRSSPRSRSLPKAPYFHITSQACSFCSLSGSSQACDRPNPGSSLQNNCLPTQTSFAYNLMIYRLTATRVSIQGHSYSNQGIWVAAKQKCSEYNWRWQWCTVLSLSQHRHLCQKLPIFGTLAFMTRQQQQISKSAYYVPRMPWINVGTSVKCS